MIIAVGGQAGSGKSTIARIVAEKLGYRYYYMGGLRRKMAQDRGMTLHQLNALGENEAWTDQEVDEYQKQLAQKEDNFVIDGRTSFHFIPNAVKLFIDVDPRIGAERVYRDLQKKDDQRNEDAKLNSVEAVLESHRQRMASDILRYKKYYGIDVYDTKKYDYVLDTSTLTVPECCEKVLEFIKKTRTGKS
jgi:cytidylate kinase